MKSYINIGTSKACLFVFLSNRLLNELRSYPLLYYAIEEALISAKNEYYSIGIMIWYSLLKDVSHANSESDSGERNIPAHDILKVRPTKESYKRLLTKFKDAAKKQYLKELSKEENEKAYNYKLLNEWEEFMKEIPYKVTI